MPTHFSYQPVHVAMLKPSYSKRHAAQASHQSTSAPYNEYICLQAQIEFYKNKLLFFKRVLDREVSFIQSVPLDGVLV